MSKTYQRTFYVHGEKIVIKARQKSDILCGYIVRINGKKYFNDGFDKEDKESVLGISIQTAVDRCFVKWAKSQPEPKRYCTCGHEMGLADDSCSKCWKPWPSDE